MAQQEPEHWQKVVEASGHHLAMATHYEECRSAYLNFATQELKMADEWSSFSAEIKNEADQRRRMVTDLRVKAQECRDEAAGVRQRLSSNIGGGGSGGAKPGDSESAAVKFEELADEHVKMADEIVGMLEEGERDMEKCRGKVRELQSSAREQREKAEVFVGKQRESYDSYGEAFAGGM